MAEINADVLNSLAAKLDGLELTEAERSVLDQLVENAAAYEPEVEGFAFDTTTGYGGLTSGANLSTTAFSLGSALGFVGPRAGMYGDPNDPIGGPRDPTKPPPP